MWILFLPLGWYLFRYIAIDFEWFNLSYWFVSTFFVLLLVFSNNLRCFVIKQLKYPFDFLDKITDKIELKKIEKLSKKSYVFLKKEFLNLKK
jgi:hypothetical protein